MAWADFAQRPHKFVEWHHREFGGRVLWLEPYPTRLPRLADLRRVAGAMRMPGQEVPGWLERVVVPALPLEPVAGGAFLNAQLWRNLLRRVKAFANPGPCELVIGKPSKLALAVARAAGFERSTYDAMDDFPAFHRGLSARCAEDVERALIHEVGRVQVSSSSLREKFQRLGIRAELVRNGYDFRPMLAGREELSQRDPDLVGYVGTIAAWFDWELVLEMARARPNKRFLLIGPLLCPPPSPLPPNVTLRPACPHPEAMQEMGHFAAGLIPFRRNALTAGVDPVKYYEYRALGIPVISTAFGEMRIHAEQDPGVLLATDAAGAIELLDQAANATVSADWLRVFRERNSWHARFAQAFAAPEEPASRADVVHFPVRGCT